MNVSTNFCRLVLQLTDFVKERLLLARSTAGVSREIFLPREPQPARGKLAEGNSAVKNHQSSIVNHQLNHEIFE